MSYVADFQQWALADGLKGIPRLDLIQTFTNEQQLAAMGGILTFAAGWINVGRILKADVTNSDSDFCCGAETVIT